VASSFDLKVPADGLAFALGLVDADGEVAAAAASGPASVARITPPAKSEPATPATIRILWVEVTLALHLLLRGMAGGPGRRRTSVPAPTFRDGYRRMRKL